MVPSGVQSAWFVALNEENCVRALNLLKDYPTLLRRGWNENPRPEGEFEWRSPGSWKRRTALHVGARRGSVDLVEEVVGMFDENGRAKFAYESDNNLHNFESLGNLLTVTDDEYKLDALAMAVINGSRDIIRMLAIGSILKCKSNPFEISTEWEKRVRAESDMISTTREGTVQVDMTTATTEDEDKRKQLRKITEEVMENLTESSSTDAQKLKAIYQESREFNFLPWEEYLFHSTFLKRPMHMFERIDEVRQNIFVKTRSTPSLRRFLCELHDGQGRTALHVAVDEGTVQKFLRLIRRQGQDYSEDLMSAPDGVGRTPLHRAAAMRDSESLRHLVGDGRIDLNERFCPWEYAESLRTDLGINLERLSQRNGFKGFGWYDVYDISTAVHIAIIHENSECVRVLLNDQYNFGRRKEFALDLQFPFTRLLELRSGEGRRFSLEALQLAALVGDASILGMLLQEVRARDLGRQELYAKVTAPKVLTTKASLERRIRWLHNLEDGRLHNLEDRLQSTVSHGGTIPSSPGFGIGSQETSQWSISGVYENSLKSNPWPAIHLVAASGNFQLLKLFIDSKNYDSFVEDQDGNTTLHIATKGREVHFDTFLIDHVSCQYARDSRVKHTGKSMDTALKGFVEREGCIELLLQAGFDIWRTNKAEQGPYPGPDATAEFLSWWYKKLAKETISLQNTLKAAANAISVTATLVATASFVGPLQPPLGYNSPDNSQNLQVTNLPVRIFIVCDTLSFYLAVAAIMLALIPSLPMPQESMLDELRRTRKMVTIAVGFLFPSIISVLVAFASASIAVVPNHDGSWNHGGLTISTVSLGGLICLGVIFLFSIRLLRLVWPKNGRVKSLFKATAL